MVDTVYKYPLDRTGQAATNRIVQEVNCVIESGPVLVPAATPFFKESLILEHVETGRTLIPGTDYRAIHLVTEATAEVGAAICAAIEVLHPDIVGDVLVSYQTIGGGWVTNVDAVIEAVAQIENQEDITDWNSIHNKPVSFLATRHLYNVEDLVGMSEVVAALNEVATAIMHERVNLPATIEDRVQALEATVIVLQAEIRELQLKAADVN